MNTDIPNTNAPRAANGEMSEQEYLALHNVIEQLAELWVALPYDLDDQFDAEDSENPWYYKGGTSFASFKGGLADCWRDLSPDQMLVDILAGRRFARVPLEDAAYQFLKNVPAKYRGDQEGSRGSQEPITAEEVLGLGKQ